MQKAIDKIDKQADKQSPAVKIIAQHIIDNYIVSDSAAEKILKDGKTLSGCYNAVKGKASKQKSGNCVVVDDATVFAWVRKYFDLTGEDLKRKDSKKANILNFDIFG